MGKEGVVWLFCPNLTSLWEPSDSFLIYISYLPRLQQITGQSDLGGMLGVPAGAVTPLQDGLWVLLQDTKHEAQCQGTLLGLHNMPTWEIKTQDQEKEEREETNSYHCYHETRQVRWVLLAWEENQVHGMTHCSLFFFQYCFISIVLQ